MARTRKYPDQLTAMQRQMLRAFEKDANYPYHKTAKRLSRFKTLCKREYLIPKPSGGWQPAPNLRKEDTFFVQEADGPDAFIKISKTSQSGILPRLQAGNPRKLKLLGTFPGDRLAVIELALAAHRHTVRGGWYKPHADVLAWMQHKDFKRI